MFSVVVTGSSELIAAIAPYRWLFAACGLASPLSFSTSKRKNYFLNIAFWLNELFLFTLTMWALYANYLVLSNFGEVSGFDFVTSAISNGHNIMTTIVQVLMQIFAIFKKKQLAIIINSIRELEFDINERCWSAASLNYFQRNFGIRYQLLTRSGIMFLCLVTLLFYFDYQLIAPTMPEFDKFAAIYSSVIVQIKSVEYCTFVQLIYELLWRLQEDLKKLKQEILRLNYKDYHAFAMNFQLCAALQRNQQLLARVWNLVNTIESYFAIPLLAFFIHNGIAIIHNINWGYINHVEGRESNRAFRICFNCLIMANMLLLSCLSQVCINSYHYFSAILHSMRLNTLNIMLRMRLREYSLQMMHQKLLFTCGGFFDINLSFFGKLVLTITTYIVILIQFKLQGKAEETQKNLIP